VAIYKVVGRGTKTNRKRSEEYVAESEDSARALAEKAGTTPETVELVLARSLDTEIAGVTFKNANNTSRQRIASEIAESEPFSLEHEQGNRHDPNAVRVLRQNGEQIGYLPQGLAELVMRRWTLKGQLPQYVIRHHGSHQRRGDDSALRVRAVGFLVLPGVTAPEAAQYLRSSGETFSAEIVLLRKLSHLVSRPKPPPRLRQPKAESSPPKSSGCATVLVTLLSVVTLLLFI
jgi:hypothetical protein